MGRAGIVLGLEVSRLARNNADWQRLLEICALSGALVRTRTALGPVHLQSRSTPDGDALESLRSRYPIAIYPRPSNGPVRWGHHGEDGCAPQPDSATSMLALNT